LKHGSYSLNRKVGLPSATAKAQTEEAVRLQGREIRWSGKFCDYMRASFEAVSEWRRSWLPELISSDMWYFLSRSGAHAYCNQYVTSATPGMRLAYESNILNTSTPLKTMLVDVAALAPCGMVIVFS